jgi:hypothetical protein
MAVWPSGFDLTTDLPVKDLSARIQSLSEKVLEKIHDAAFA